MKVMKVVFSHSLFFMFGFFTLLEILSFLTCDFITVFHYCTIFISPFLLIFAPCYCYVINLILSPSSYFKPYRNTWSKWIYFSTLTVDKNSTNFLCLLDIIVVILAYCISTVSTRLAVNICSPAIAKFYNIRHLHVRIHGYRINKIKAT